MYVAICVCMYSYIRHDNSYYNYRWGKIIDTSKTAIHYNNYISILFPEVYSISIIR